MRVKRGEMEQRRNEKAGEAVDPRIKKKPTYQLLRPARFPHVEVRRATSPGIESGATLPKPFKFMLSFCAVSVVMRTAGIALTILINDNVRVRLFDNSAMRCVAMRWAALGCDELHLDVSQLSDDLSQELYEIRGGQATLSLMISGEGVRAQFQFIPDSKVYRLESQPGKASTCIVEATRLPPRRTRLDSWRGRMTDIRMWESWRTMPLVGGLSRGSRVSRRHTSSFRRCSSLP
ncbi:hypothetical protein PR048_028159 [Dryococelus australis]|uniref:Uncharacterized protein n=1 Tax=Dryococelus australis TaxID=614101 RepID=A0ABQ9GII6_9NEOP|nr:hypothetical protein PR048_028159 [Dryococelus australis]